MTDPAISIQDYLLSLLKAREELSSLAEEDQIRPESDMGEPSIGAFAVTIGVQDKGSHLGLPGRVLVDVDATVEVRASVTEDPDLSVTRGLSRAVFSAVNGIGRDIHLDGWVIRSTEPWIQSPLGISDLYRYATFSTTFFLQDKTTL